jgi:LCP family protein required for cell wall assembly
MLVALQLVVGLFAVRVRSGTGDIVIGRPPAAVQTALPAPAPVAPPPSTVAPRRRAAGAIVARGHAPGVLPELAARPGLRQPDTSQYGPAATFDDDDGEPVPDDLVFVLAIGSDARPGERLDRARADSIHLLAVNPRSGTGTVLGFPRDTWTTIPGHGRGKLNTALALGGPDLLAETVREITGLPVHWWVLTGFRGIETMVDELGRLAVPVARRMADRASGAAFERGWHLMSGREVLAFSRDRHSTAQGDISRSANHGVVLLQALRKLRVETADVGDVRRWVDVLWRHARIDAGFDDVVRLGITARRLDPDELVNVVAPCVVGTAGGQSVVYLTDEATALFEDLRADATVGEAPPPTTTTTTTTPVPSTLVPG